ncbi:MAG: ketopantoate reductase family protein [Proteobacteria bacterium]|nr:ketopantoate reductase family protein [Pseudomonadota bacterium]
MRVCILGAGALGSAIGGTLAEAGHDVTLINRNRAHIEAIQKNGLRLRTDGVDRIVRLESALTTDGMAPVDLVIVLVKSLDTESAILSALPIIGPETIVISLQNGLGQEETLANVVGQNRVLAGKTYAGGVMIAPGHVISGTRGKETIIGELDGTMSARVTGLAKALTDAGLETMISPNIVGAMWDKLLVNVATGALAGITGLTYGALYAIPEIEATAIAAVSEAMAVAEAMGIALQTNDPRAPWVKAAAGLPPEFKTSMLQSLEKGALTEIDFINGSVVRAGARVNIATPVNATLVALIKGVERKRVPQSKEP